MMARVAELGDCPLCFGPILPLSVCGSCGSITARPGLEEVEPTIACEDCGASNATQFACSACNARFSYKDIVRPEGPTCPVCHSSVPKGAQLCPTCSAVLPVAGVPGQRPKRRVLGEYGEEDVHEIARIPSVGRQRGEALCAGGYNALWKVSKATVEELGAVKGIGPNVAVQIKDALRFLLVIGRPKNKEEVLSEEYVCPLCGTVTSLFATRCHDCGASLDEEELDEEFRREVEREEDKGLLAYYDVRLLENPDDVDLHYARAILLTGMGRATDALAVLDRVLELQPGHRRAILAKTRALAAVRGVGGAATVLREAVSTARVAGGVQTEVLLEAEAEAALRSLGVLEEEECASCGEVRPPGAASCPACGHSYVAAAVEEETAVPEDEERLLEELERAIAGEEKAPPPPLKGEVPADLVARKRAMLAFLLKITGVSRRAAEATSGFFQNIEQVGLSEVSDVAGIPGVAPAEARLIKRAVDAFLAPPMEPSREVPEVAPPPVPEPVAPPRPAPPRARPTPSFGLAIAPRRSLVDGSGFVDARGRVDGLVDGAGFVDASLVTDLRLGWRKPSVYLPIPGIDAAARALPTLLWVAAASLGLLVVALVALAYAGIRVGFLSGLWLPWPPDEWKVVLGVLALAGVVAWRYARRRGAGAAPTEARSVRARVASFLAPTRTNAVNLVLLALGLLGLLMAALVALAYAGVYVEPFRGLWRSWPGDDLKVVLGLAAIVFFVWFRFLRKSRRSAARS